MEENVTVSIVWDIGRIYKFRGKCVLNRAEKKIYLGRFLESAPDGLDPNFPYCVKVIDVVVKSMDAPQHREYHELVDYKGDHLRPILARNDAAKACADSLRKTGTCTSTKNCVIVEPLLDTCKELFRNCAQKPIAARLDALLQIASGCEELTRPENRLGPYYIQAHRDVKKDNILVCKLNGTDHYYLIDFPSIRLNKNDPDNADLDFIDLSGLELPGATLNGGMSPGNTAPEYLETKDFKVSGKSDVYALGMLLAELFLTIPGAKSSGDNSPNSNWIFTHSGWLAYSRMDKSKLTPAENRAHIQKINQDLRYSFIDALERYEPHAIWNSTWIEQDLIANGIQVQWETMADGRILSAIRKLFFQSTRVDPDKRISLPRFIKLLQDIIALEKRSLSRIPVSLYLFDQTDFDHHRANYRLAAQHVFAQEKNYRWNQSASALCVGFRKSLPSDWTWMESIQRMGDGPLSGVPQLLSAIDQCPTRNGTGQNTVLHALNSAVQELLGLMDSENSPYTFTGQIHLFSPEVPTLSSIAPITTDSGNVIDMMTYAGMMNTTFEGIPIREVYLYSSGAPDICSGDSHWYKYFPLNPPKTPEEPAYSDLPDPTVTPVPSCDPIESKSSRESKSPAAEESDRYYILLPDGTKVWLSA